MTRLCAEAIGYRGPFRKGDDIYDERGIHIGDGPWWPISNDAQAMALVKKLRPHVNPGCGGWMVESRRPEIFANSESLNRAIVKYVAQAQFAKKKATT